MAKTKKTYNFIDLFAGLCGIRLGFQQALAERGLQGRCVFTSEIKAAAITALNHNFSDAEKRIDEQGVNTTPVVIEDDIWIGANAVILPGVTIGQHSVVAAGAIVTKDVPPHSLVAGVPAKVIRQI